MLVHFFLRHEFRLYFNLSRYTCQKKNIEFKNWIYSFIEQIQHDWKKKKQRIFYTHVEILTKKIQLNGGILRFIIWFYFQLYNTFIKYLPISGSVWSFIIVVHIFRIYLYNLYSDSHVQITTCWKRNVLQIWCGAYRNLILLSKSSRIRTTMRKCVIYTYMVDIYASEKRIVIYHLR